MIFWPWSQGVCRYLECGPRKSFNAISSSMAGRPSKTRWFDVCRFARDGDGSWCNWDGGCEGDCESQLVPLCLEIEQSSLTPHLSLCSSSWDMHIWCCAGDCGLVIALASLGTCWTNLFICILLLFSGPFWFFSKLCLCRLNSFDFCRLEVNLSTEAVQMASGG